MSFNISSWLQDLLGSLYPTSTHNASEAADEANVPAVQNFINPTYSNLATSGKLAQGRADVANSYKQHQWDTIMTQKQAKDMAMLNGIMGGGGELLSTLLSMNPGYQEISRKKRNEQADWERYQDNIANGGKYVGGNAFTNRGGGTAGQQLSASTGNPWFSSFSQNWGKPTWDNAIGYDEMVASSKNRMASPRVSNTAQTSDNTPGSFIANILDYADQMKKGYNVSGYKYPMKKNKTSPGAPDINSTWEQKYG